MPVNRAPRPVVAAARVTGSAGGNVYGFGFNNPNNPALVFERLGAGTYRIWSDWFKDLRTVYHITPIFNGVNQPNGLSTILDSAAGNITVSLLTIDAGVTPVDANFNIVLVNMAVGNGSAADYTVA